MSTNKKVVNLFKNKEDDQNALLEFVSKLDMEKGGIIILHCDDLSSVEPDYNVFSSYDGEFQELVALQVLQEHIRSLMYEVNEQ